MSEVSLAIDNLVETVEAGTPYKDLDALSAYIQWTKDSADYEVALRAHEAELRNAKRRREAVAISEFRASNGRMCEDVRWCWSPLWNVLSLEEDLLRTLPPLPWRHDGEMSDSIGITWSM